MFYNSNKPQTIISLALQISLFLDEHLYNKIVIYHTAVYFLVYYSTIYNWTELHGTDVRDSHISALFHCCLQLIVMLTRTICFIPLLFTVDSYVDKKCLLYSIVVYSWVMLTRNICFIPLLFTVDSYVDKKCLLYSILVYSWVMLTRNICFIPLPFTVDSYVDKKCLLYSIVVYSWQLCWQEMSALFHCCLQLSYVDKKYLLYSIAVYSWQSCWQEMSALFHCCLQLTVMLTRNVCFISLLFTVDSYVDKKCLLYLIVVYSWQLCWQEMSALFHCCLQLIFMLTSNFYFIPLLVTVDSYVDKKCLLYSISVYSWQLCWQEISALFHCCLQLTVMLTRNVCFIPLLFTVDSYVDKIFLLYSIVVYNGQLCWQEIFALLHCCLQLTVMLTSNFYFIPLLVTVNSYVDSKE